MKNTGVVIRIDEEHDICVVWFRCDPEETIFPISGDYLEVISESA
jgi:hypothetical protein